jgi:SAM-dependent methyltransferase
MDIVIGRYWRLLLSDDKLSATGILRELGDRAGVLEADCRRSSEAFRFGRNWQRYVAWHLDPQRERSAAESLKRLVGDVNGKSFLDIGSGSGLFSLCAYRQGAREIVSLDVDGEAVAATATLRERVGAPPSWRVLHRSILDSSLLHELEPADVVYAWGVLHHTGEMYRAIAKAAALVKPGGKLAIAIYNRVENRLLNSRRWWYIKRAYNRAPAPLKKASEWAYRAVWPLAQLSKGRNPLRAAREYRRTRGMALSIDLIDWLGGFPCEFASADEVIKFCEDACGLRLSLLLPAAPRELANNQFVFERPAA